MGKAWSIQADSFSYVNTRILGNIGAGAAEALPALIEGLGTQDPSLCEAAAEALGKIRGGDLLRAVLSLATSLCHESKVVRRAAANALGSIAPEGEEAVLHLDPALTDSEQDVSRAAADALIRIRPLSLS